MVGCDDGGWSGGDCLPVFISSLATYTSCVTQASFSAALSLHVLSCSTEIIIWAVAKLGEAVPMEEPGTQFNGY